jgi:hypothetical protein
VLVFTSAVLNAVKEFEPLQLSDCGGVRGGACDIDQRLQRPHNITTTNVLLLLSDKLQN